MYEEETDILESICGYIDIKTLHKLSNKTSSLYDKQILRLVEPNNRRLKRA